MAGKLDLNKISKQYSKKYSAEYYKVINDYLSGKNITFQGTDWSDQRKGDWKKITTRVRRVRPFNSGVDFPASIEIDGSDKKTYSIHPDTPIIVDFSPKNYTSKDASKDRYNAKNNL